MTIHAKFALDIITTKIIFDKRAQQDSKSSASSAELAEAYRNWANERLPKMKSYASSKMQDDLNVWIKGNHRMMH
jgi:hypothetical protein